MLKRVTSTGQKVLSFQPGPGGMAPSKGGAKKGHSAINKAATREYTIDIHEHIHGVGFRKHGPRALEIWKSAMKELGTPDGHWH